MSETKAVQETANEVLVELVEKLGVKLGEINGGDAGAVATFKETLLDAIYEVEDRTEDEEERFARGAMLDARAALGDEILTSIGRLAALRERLQKLPFVSPDADTLWGMAFAMEPAEAGTDRDTLSYIIGHRGEHNGTFLACAVDDVETAIEHVEDVTFAGMFTEWAKDADATTVVPDHLKRDLKDCMLLVPADVCEKLNVPKGTTIAAVVQSLPAKAVAS